MRDLSSKKVDPGYRYAGLLALLGQIRRSRR